MQRCRTAATCPWNWRQSRRRRRRPTTVGRSNETENAAHVLFVVPPLFSSPNESSQSMIPMPEKNLMSHDIDVVGKLEPAYKVNR